MLRFLVFGCAGETCVIIDVLPIRRVYELSNSTVLTLNTLCREFRKREILRVLFSLAPVPRRICTRIVFPETVSRRFRDRTYIICYYLLLLSR